MKEEKDGVGGMREEKGKEGREGEGKEAKKKVGGKDSNSNIIFFFFLDNPIFYSTILYFLGFI